MREKNWLGISIHYQKHSSHSEVCFHDSVHRKLVCNSIHKSGDVFVIPLGKQSIDLGNRAKLSSLCTSSGDSFVGLAYQGKDIVFRFIIEYSSLMDFGSIGEISNYRRNKIIVGKASFSRLCYYCYYYYYCCCCCFLLQQIFFPVLEHNFCSTICSHRRISLKREGIKKINSWNFFYLFSDL
jgi:hypothetical protein